MLIIVPVPCIIHIKSSKQNTDLLYVDYASTHKNEMMVWNDASPTVIFIFRE